MLYEALITLFAGHENFVCPQEAIAFVPNAYYFDRFIVFILSKYVYFVC